MIKKSILIVDDDKTLANAMKLTLIEEGYEVVAVNRADVAFKEIKNRFFDVAILDLMLPDTKGMSLLNFCIEESPQTCFIMFTGNASISSAVESLKAGAYDYITKPFDIDHLKIVIRRGIEKQALLNSNQILFERLEKEKKKLEIVIEAGRILSNINSLEELADIVTAYALKISDAEKASLMMIDDEADELVIRGSSGIDKEKLTQRMKIGKFIAGWVAQQGEALLVKDIETDPRFKFYYTKGPRYKSKSFISLPLKSDNQVIGVMNITDKLAESDIFTDEDLRYLTLLGHEAVAQIKNIRLREKLSYLAITDSLTGLFNHRYCHEQLDFEVKRAQRYRHPLSLIMLDIDHFKSYNDRFGHLEGDRVLKQVAMAIKQNIRQVDVLCRYGGEEFLVILPDTDIGGAKFVAEKIRKSVSQTPLLFKEEKEKVFVSGGVAEFRDGLSKTDFISHVDKALYQAKENGRDKICLFNEKK